MMEDYFKSTFIALLRYSSNKPQILKEARLRADHLLQISEHRLSVEEAFAEIMPFQMPSKVGEHFFKIDRKLDVLKPLKRQYSKRKSKIQKLDDIVTKRHALIHKMQIDRELNRHSIKRMTDEVTNSLSLVYIEIARFYGWECVWPLSTNFIRRVRA